MRSERVKEVLRRTDALEDAGDLAGAIEAFSAGIEKLPDAPVLYALRGRLYRIRKQWRKAIADFDAALALKPDLPTTLFFRGTSLAIIGEFDRAIADLEGCIRLQPESADAYWHIGTIHSHLKNLDGAIVAYKKAFEIDPKTYPGIPDYLVELQGKLKRKMSRAKRAKANKAKRRSDP
jgi:tetratricopeptide (TPR) repeat protein